MRTTPHHWRISLVGLLVLAAAGCSPISYPKAHLAESMQAVLQEEGLVTSVHVIEHTLAVHLEYPKTLSQVGGQIGIGPAFDEATRKVIGAIHRVLLSSDADVRFYVLLVSDPKIPGAAASNFVQASMSASAPGCCMRKCDMTGPLTPSNRTNRNPCARSNSFTCGKVKRCS